MEPISALGVAAAVVQFVEFSGKLMSETIQIYRKKQGEKGGECQDVPSVYDRLVECNNRLIGSIGSNKPQPLSPADQDMLNICAECNKVALQLFSVLQRLKRNGRVKVWASFRQALRTVWSENKIERMNTTIDSFRSQISMCILVDLRELIIQRQQDARLADDGLLTTVKETQATVLEIQKRFRGGQWESDMAVAISESYLDPTATASRALRLRDMKVSQADKDRFSQEFLTRLHFPEQEFRERSIEAAYEKTFEWIFRPPPNSAWSGFAEWLESDDCLYWITGKPAAGKSTLMKFLYKHPLTEKHLQSWAAGDKLVVASFYFWNSGSRIQMSLDGFGRTLLHQILRELPHLIPTIFPHRWETYLLLGPMWAWRQPWSWDELLKAFRTLVREIGSSTKLFFFIDGLDEFDGDHNELVQLIKSLVVPDVKVCVSSRPWNVFEDGFRKRPSLKVSDMTRGDIRHFVKTSFKRSPGFAELRALDPESAKQLIENICSKSQGVFLWVSLVTRSLLDGLRDGERLSELHQRLDNLPADLEALFSKILTSIVKANGRASQLLQIVRASRTPLTLLALSFADEDDPEFVFTAPFQELSSQKIQARAEIMRRRLNATCQGLVEGEGTRDSSVPLADAQITFLHRTVKDYIYRGDIWPKLLGSTDKRFDPSLRLCVAEIMMFKISPTPQDYDHDYGVQFWNRIYDILAYTTDIQPTSRETQARLLTELDAVAQNRAETPDLSGVPFLERWSDTSYSQTDIPVHWTGTCSAFDSFLELAVYFQMTDYLETILSKPTHQFSSVSLSRALLIAAAVSENFRSSMRFRIIIPPEFQHRMPSLPLIKLLMDHGADPNRTVSFSTLGSFTPWEALIAMRNNSASMREICEHFLERGADPDVWLKAAKEWRMGPAWHSSISALARKKKRKGRASCLSCFSGG